MTQLRHDTEFQCDLPTGQAQVEATSFVELRDSSFSATDDHFLPPGLFEFVNRESPTEIVDMFATDLESGVKSRLSDLTTWSVEESEDQNHIRVSSLTNFISFMKLVSNSDLRIPDIVATFTGNVRAEWFNSWEERICIEFLGDRKVHYMQFYASIGGKSIKPDSYELDWMDLFYKMRESNLPEYTKV